MDSPIVKWERQGIAMLGGRRSEGIYKLALHWEYVFAVSGFSVFNLDCAICFNPFVITAETRKRSLPPEPILEKILVQRAFTPYQILDALHSITKQKSDDTIYFLLAPCKQFFDPDVADEEGLFLLEKMVLCLEKIRSLKIPTLIVESLKYDHKNFQKILPKLIDLSGDFWELQIEERLSRIKIRKENLLE
ncbi:hypothetical protein [Leptospira idonii]|uniref:Uncharacterized protein n=1 Tax=Leptospira idonii TaxID=1193500 RepID=A0A4R9M2J9_9LEPT|nr:hypothetical protein [Leptospira idonii]TGN20201.1 hypothetical protein EHS15_05795 [Leptospira idonii]